MKILTLNANLKCVGTYGRCYYYSRELVRHGHDVTMVTVSQVSRYRPVSYYKSGFLSEAPQKVGSGPWVRLVEGPGIGYRWLPGYGSGPLDILWRTKELLSGRYDVLFGFEYQPNVSWPFYLTRRFRSYRFLSDWCDWYAGQSNTLRGNKLAHRLDNHLEERIRHLADGVTVISKELYRRAQKLGISQSRIAHIPQGVDTEYLHPISKQEARRQLNIPLDRPVLVGVCDGDMAQTIRVFHRILKEIPDALYVVAGQYDPTVGRESEKLGISANVHISGWVSDVDYPRYLACADAMFLPLPDTLGNRARFPAKLLDYMACGRPVVSSPVGEVADVYAEGEVGMAVGQGEEEMAMAVVRLLKDRDLCEQMGHNARRLMVDKWDWRLRGAQIEEMVKVHSVSTKRETL